MRSRFQHIDGLRAIAVISVVIFHVCVYNASQGDDLEKRVIATCSRGVDLFFVLSGFCLAMPYLRQARMLGTLKIDYGVFVSRRFARIAPPYYLALVAFTLLSFTPLRYPTAPGATLFGSGLRELLPSFAFVTTVSPIANSSFWTIGIEARWYVLCPFLIAAYVRSRVLFAAIALVSLGIYHLPSRHILDFGTLPAFMLGIVAADIALSEHESGIVEWIGAAALFAYAMSMQRANLLVDHGDLLWQTAIFAAVVVSRSKPSAKVLSAKPIAFLGIASYSIYLVHQPIIAALAFAHVGPIARGFIAVIAGVLFWAVFERWVHRPTVQDALAAAVRDRLKRYCRPPMVVNTRRASMPSVYVALETRTVCDER